MRLSLTLGITLAILVFATSAFADTVTFSYGDGSTLIVQGTLTGTFSGGVFTATKATGTYDGHSLSLAALGSDPVFNFKDLVYFPPVSRYSVDMYGLLFNVAGLGDANLCGGLGCANSDSYTTISDFGGIVNTTSQRRLSIRQSLNRAPC